MMYKVKKKKKNEIVPNYILEMFDAQEKWYNLRGNDFNVQRYNTTRFDKNSIKNLGLYTWSRLSDDDRKKTSIYLFHSEY